MKDIRQGNDLKVAWSIFKQDGEPFRLEGLDVSLYLKSVFGRKELNDFVITGNIIQWTFYGKDQKSTGKYSLELVVNEGEKGMITTDTCDFVNLVSCSCKLQGGEDAPNVETESIELTSTLEYVSGGGNYDDTALWRALDGKVDKVEGLGLSEENYTAEDKEKLAGLENYDDSGIKEELAKKVESEVVVDTESTEDFEFGYDDTKIRQEIAELSAEVSGLSEGIALRNVGAEDTDESVDEPEIPAPTPSASNEWKCVADRRMLEGEKKIIFTTYADGTPLQAKEVVVQLLCDTSSQKEINGYVVIQSTNNKTRSSYGAIQFERNAASSQNQALDQMHLKASPMYMVAEIYRSVKCAIATPVNQQVQGGSVPFQIYEDIVSIELAPNEGLTSAVPYLKIYAR